jgi:hypothetical protein
MRRLPWAIFAIVAASSAAAVGLAVVGGAGLFVVAFSVAVALVFGLTGAIVASRLPGNAIGRIFCAFALLSCVSAVNDAYVSYGEGGLPGRAWLAWINVWSVNAFSPALVGICFLLFPTGKLPSARWSPLAWAIVLGAAVHAVSAALSPGVMLDYPIENPAGVGSAPWLRGLAEVSLIALVTPLVLLAAGSLFARLRRSSGVERQQIKWFAYAAALLALFLVVANAARALLGDISGTTLEALVFVVFVVVISCIPISMGVAIMRYRLYDIDLIINRTLVYAALSAVLILVYLACVVLLQQLFRALSGETSQLAIVASTLAIAALFNPLRRRIQDVVDRRFYRARYDARETLARFSVALRDEVELDALRLRLVGAVEETLRPEHVALWLRDPERRRAEGGTRG